ncbi:hypothetical protein AKO1_007530 [Acrasis kona]|uniref:Cyclin-like domain-containing protein n=1 Tax=Acrasis kona TaxID=1008807 RepID=A0AAW2YRD9_9EUKA
MKKGAKERRRRCSKNCPSSSALPPVVLKHYTSPQTPPLKPKRIAQMVVYPPTPYDSVIQQQKIKEFDCREPEHEHMYLVEQIEQLQLQEQKNPPTGPYLSSMNTDITPSTRSVITDYMVRVCQNFKLSDNTLFLAINVMDRFLATERPHMVSKDKLHIISLTSILIASKYNDVNVPSVDQIVKDCEHDREDILCLETIILNTLRFTLSVATPSLFLQLYFQFWECDSLIKVMSQFVCEVATQDYGSLLYYPSDIAYSSIHLCKYIHAVHKGMRHDAESFRSCVSRCVLHLVDCVFKMSKTRLTGTMKKYSTEEPFNVVQVVTNTVNFIRLAS